MVDFIRSVKLPFTDWKNLLIGIGLMALINIALSGIALILFIIGALIHTVIAYIALAFFFILAMIISSFAFSGYVVRISNNAMQDKDLAIPPWDNWNQLFDDGVKVSIVYFAYSALPVVMIIVGLVPIASRFYEILRVGLLRIDPSLLIDAVKSSSASLVVAGILLLAVLSYFSYMAMLCYASKRSLSDAFKLKDVFNKSMRSGYFMGFLFLFAYTSGLAIIGGAVSAGLSAVGGFIPGLAVSYFVSMVSLVTISDAMGQAYK
jgi:hypothetical protein